MNSIPVWSGRLSRSPNPLLRNSGVSAISAVNTVVPTVTLGPVGVGTGVGDGTAVAVGGGVCVAVATTCVAFGVRVAAGVAVSVGKVVGIGVAAAVGSAVAVEATVLVAVATTAVVGISCCCPELMQAMLLNSIATARADTMRPAKTLRQMNQGRTVTTALSRFRFVGLGKRVACQMLAHRIAQNALTSPVYDPH